MNWANRFLLFLCAMALLGCSTTSGRHTIAANSGSKAAAQTDPDLIRQECVDAYLIGDQHYDRGRSASGLDVSSFHPAISSFKLAVARCAGHEYEDDALISLANACFYIGDFDGARQMYEKVASKFPSSSFNTGGRTTASKEAALLRACTNDPYMDTFRRARVFELHQQYSEAIAQYVQAARSHCSEIAIRSRKSVRELSLMLSGEGAPGIESLDLDAESRGSILASERPNESIAPFAL